MREGKTELLKRGEKPHIPEPGGSTVLSLVVWVKMEEEVIQLGYIPSSDLVRCKQKPGGRERKKERD